MTTPAAPGIGLIVLYYTGSAEGLDGRILPALVAGVDQGAPDFGLHLVAFKTDGSTLARWHPVSAATWSSGGSNPAQPHWDYLK
jgi:hypothetical protein